MTLSQKEGEGKSPLRCRIPTPLLFLHRMAQNVMFHDAECVFFATVLPDLALQHCEIRKRSVDCPLPIYLISRAAETSPSCMCGVVGKFKRGTSDVRRSRNGKQQEGVETRE